VIAKTLEAGRSAREQGKAAELLTGRPPILTDDSRRMRLPRHTGKFDRAESSSTVRHRPRRLRRTVQRPLKFWEITRDHGAALLRSTRCANLCGPTRRLHFALKMRSARNDAQGSGRIVNVRTASAQVMLAPRFTGPQAAIEALSAIMTREPRRTGVDRSMSPPPSPHRSGRKCLTTIARGAR